MISSIGPRGRAALAMLAGIFGALGLAPYGVWPATILSLSAAFFLFSASEDGRRALLTGWAFGTGYFGLAFLWIVEPFFVDPQRHGWMAPFALVFMAAGLALFWAVAFRLAYAVPRARGLALVVMLGVAELARAYVFSGFPWAGLSQIWVGHGPDLMLASIGPHGLSLVTLLSGLALSRAAVGTLPLPVRAAGPLAFGVFVVFGIWMQVTLPNTELRDATIRITQPNAPQHQKWDPDMVPVFLRRQLDFTGASPIPDLIIWPETSIPALLEYAGPLLADVSRVSGGAPVIAGIQRRSEDRRIYNSAVLLTGGETPVQIYDKHHLVPFGEYVPLGDLAARFGLSGFATQEGQGFSAGPGPRLMDLGPLGRAIPLICYEAVFPQFARSDEGRADLLVQITNDAWFGQNSGPYQHLAQARMRAIEQGLPMIRSANTGISAVIDGHGRVLNQIPLGRSGFIDVALPEPLPPTLYSRSGDWPVLILLLVSSLVLIRTGRTRFTD